MHLRSICRTLGVLALLVVVSMGLSLAWATYEYYHLPSPATLLVLQGFLTAIAMGIGLSALLILLGHRAANKIEMKEALLLVTLCWLIGAIVGALPFYIWAHMAGANTHAFSNFVNCFFETMSGLTATGASILPSIQDLPRPLLLWRAHVQWLGGLGIVVLFVAVLPWISSGTTRIYKAETTGISDAGTADIREMARGLWLIYTGFTLVQVLVMKVVDHQTDWFTALTFAFSTASTAGYSVFNQSAGPLSHANQWVVIVFMVLGGVNYALYFECVKGRFYRVRQDSECRTYFLLLTIGIILITLNIHGKPIYDMAGKIVDGDFLSELRHGTFQYVSIQTTTGFTNGDFNRYPLFSQLILLAAMFIGGCGGSTSGGIKVVRVLSAVKLLLLDIEKVYRPAIVRPLKLGRCQLDQRQRQGVLVFVLLMISVTCAGMLALSILEQGKQLDILTLFSASAACINNVGPGLSFVGPLENYSIFSDSSKLILSSLMVIGRLEIFTVLAVLLPRFWYQS